MRNGKTTEFTSKELVQSAEQVWSHLQDSANEVNPIFVSVDMESPLGFALFLGCSTNFKKIYLSGLYNLSAMLKQLPAQGSTWAVVDQDVFNVKAPEGYSDLTSGVKNVLVAGKAGRTELFKGAKVQSLDVVTIN